MPFTPETGEGLDTANAYASLEDWTAYYEFHLYAPSTTDAKKQSAIVMASRIIDAAVKWKGAKVKETQGLGWPRYGVVVDHSSVELANGNGEVCTYVADDIVPKPVKDAVLEYCRFLIAQDRDTTFEEVSNIKREKVGPLETEYFGGAAKPGQIPDTVLRLIRDYYEDTAQSTIGNMRLIRA